MADLTNAPSTYATGGIDTQTPVVDLVTPYAAKHVNNHVAATIQIETTLGIGTDLKGTHPDLVTRLAVKHNPDGTHKTLAVSEGGTGSAAANLGMRLAGSTTAVLQFLPFLRVAVWDTAQTTDWVVPTGVTSFKIECWGAGGGGGGGGGGANDGAGNAVTGGNGQRGGNGGYAVTVITGAVPNDSYTIVVGAAGTAGAAGTLLAGTGTAGNGGTGGTGGTSSVSLGVTLCSASGGPGGLGGGGGNSSIPAAGSNQRTYDFTTLSVGTVVVGNYGLAGHGALSGRAGLGGASTPANGEAGAVGRAGMVVISY